MLSHLSSQTHLVPVYTALLQHGLNGLGGQPTMPLSVKLFLVHGGLWVCWTLSTGVSQTLDWFIMIATLKCWSWCA